MSMIPYFEVQSFFLGPIQIQVWGLFVAFGFLAGMGAVLFFIKKKSLESDIVWELSFWLILFSMVGARLVHVFFYDWIYYSQNFFSILKIWEGGLSSFGGFFAAVLVFWLYVKKRKVGFLKYADALVFGLPLGLCIGRIGCFLIHDHPGTFTSFFLGVAYPDGTRHDHGLYLSLLGLFIFIVLLGIFEYEKRKPLPSGIYLISFLSIYGLVRFVLDFFRAWEGLLADQRLWGLTFAQYGSLAFLFLSLYTYRYIKKKSLSGKGLID